MAKNRRIKTMFDLRKTKRSQVFLDHRFQHFIASDDRTRICVQSIWQHLNLMCSFSYEEKFTAFLLVMYKQTPQMIDLIRIKCATDAMQHIHHEVNDLVTRICYIVNKFNINYIIDNEHIRQYERDTLTFRPNINSISKLLAELFARLLHSFCIHCKNLNQPITKDIFHLFEMCYTQLRQYKEVIQLNLHTIHELTQGIGRFQRTKTIIEQDGLMFMLMEQHNQQNDDGDDNDETLIVLKIINNICKGFPENIPILLKFNIFVLIGNQLTNTVKSSYQAIEECLYILENICGNHRSDIKAVIQAHLISPIFNCKVII